MLPHVLHKIDKVYSHLTIDLLESILFTYYISVLHKFYYLVILYVIIL